MTKNRPFTPREREIIEEGAASGWKTRTIQEELAAKGFIRSVDTIRVCPSFYLGRLRLENAAPKPVHEAEDAKPKAVVYGDLVIHREVRIVDVMTLNGIMAQKQVSVSAGVGWQGAA